MTSGKKIVLVHRYYAPDTPPYATILQSIAEALAGAGHDVTVLTCQPSYNRKVVWAAPARETVNSVRVVRWPVLDDRTSLLRKGVNMMWFLLRLSIAHQEFRNAQVVMAATAPPVMVAWLCGVRARQHRASFVYHKQDIWPEVSGMGGSIARRLAVRSLRRVDRWTERRANRVVVLSSDMAAAVRARGTARAPLSVINNFDPWVLAERDGPSSGRGNEFNIVFAGNLGRFQGLEYVAELIQSLHDAPGLRWHFFGHGPMETRFAELAREGAPVQMHGYVPADQLSTYVRLQADLGVVSLNENVIRYAYPSKMMTYLRQGCPVLALVEPDSELAQMVRENQIGITGPQTDTPKVANQLRFLGTRSSSVLNGAAERCRQVYDEQFSRDRQLRQWVALFEEVAA